MKKHLKWKGGNKTVFIHRVSGPMYRKKLSKNACTKAIAEFDSVADIRSMPRNMFYFYMSNGLFK